MDKRHLVLIIAAGGGIGVGALAMNAVHDAAAPAIVGNTGRPTPQPGSDRQKGGDTAAPVDPVIESIAALLDREISERHVLAEEIRALRADVDALERRLGAGEVAVTTTAPAPVRVRPSRQQPASSEDRLLAAGFSERQIESIERREAEATMQRMMLDDRARREGWVNTPRYFEEIRALDSGPESVRAFLGDEAYDRYLYASGSPNRLSVQSVIATSPAEQAGLRQGDVILSYGDQRVYSNRQLIELRSSGAQGEPVSVKILRDGEALDVSLPRGPIGIQTGRISVDPSGAETE